MAGLITLYDVVSYFEMGRSFLLLKNSGRKTSGELEMLCKETLSRLEEPKEETPEIDRETEVKDLLENDFYRSINERLISPTELLDYLSPLQKKILEKEYDKLVSSCSDRTARWLRMVDFNDFVNNYLIEENNALMKIRNLGKKAFPELVGFKETFKKVLFRITHSPEEDFPREKLILEKGKWFEEDFVYDYYVRQGHVPMFWILEKELRSDHSRKMDILLNTYPIFEGYRFLTYKELREKYNLSAQRIYQIKNKTFKHFFSAENPLLTNRKEEWAFYKNLIGDEEVLWQDDDRISTLIEQENIHFTRGFVLQVLSLLTDTTHMLLGGLDSPPGKNIMRKNSVLIPIDPAFAFNFNRFISDVRYLISINQARILSDFESYILRSPGWLKYKEEILEGVIKVASEILEHEFGLATVSGKVITPPPPVLPKHPSDVIYEILKQQGTPMHIDDLFTEFKKILPGHKYTSSKQLRPLLYQHDLITHKGRKSMYMLKEWKHIKSGTIRETIIEFLNGHDRPRAVREITNHVLQYFPETNINSIRTSMIKDSKKRFKQYKNGCFGLSDKTYPDKTGDPATLGISNNPFDERLSDLEKFISQHWHFPFSVSTDQNEMSLYRWWRLQCVHFDKLTQGQKTEVERIKNQYAGLDTEKKVYEWNNRYNILIGFLLTNQRMPSPDSRGLEKLLHEWYLRATSDFNRKNGLSDEQRRKYMDIEKMAKIEYSSPSS
ncbi:hypothetical protein [Proteiniphilum sp. X52]|uniref:hypothetical protein n=1 Tax=Proteiniphilum sp. X52 TaxID=2382159 RepID=UPI0011CE093E|nr:hypothetical protein [Proteiniphilum sp. X52]